MTATAPKNLNLLADIQTQHVKAVSAKKRYHCGAVAFLPGTNEPSPLQGPIIGGIDFPIFERIPGPVSEDGSREMYPRPGSYKDLTDEQVSHVKKSCASLVVRLQPWADEAGHKATRATQLSTNRSDYRPEYGQDGKPLDVPMSRFVYMREVPLDATGGLPQAGGMELATAMDLALQEAIRKQDAAATAANEAAIAEESTLEAEHSRIERSIAKKAKAAGLEGGKPAGA